MGTNDNTASNAAGAGPSKQQQQQPLPSNHPSRTNKDGGKPAAGVKVSSLT
jgi:hypothetical protein